MNRYSLTPPFFKVFQYVSAPLRIQAARLALPETAVSLPPDGAFPRQVQPLPPCDASRAASRRNAAAAPATCSEKRDVFSEQVRPSEKIPRD